MTGIQRILKNLLEDLDFADDIYLLSPSLQHLQLQTDKLMTEAQQKVGRIMNKDKTNVIWINKKKEKSKLDRKN